MTEEQYKARHRVKERLSAYLNARKEHKQVTERLQVLESRMVNVGAQVIDGMPKGGSGHDPMPDMLDAKNKLVERYRALAETLIKTQIAIEEAIAELDSTERMVMRHRYIEGLTWEQVCVAMDYSWMQTHRIHARALDRLAEKEVEKC